LSNQTVIVYSHEQCRKSERLKRQLDSWGIDFEERNIKENSDHLKILQDQGIFATPTMLIGDTYIEGLQFNRIKKELGIQE
jgi:glutaredoxin